MYNKAILICFLSLLFCGCAHVNSDKNDTKRYEYLNHVILNHIKSSTTSIQKSLKALNNTNLVRYGDKPLPFENVQDPLLKCKLSVSYYGPVGEVVEKVANTVHYKVHFFGKVPPLPVVVILGRFNEPVHDSALNILTDIAVQSGKQISIKINTKAKVISVRYNGASWTS